jgi:hypothetical protein
VKESAKTVGEVPSGVVMLTSTVPVPAGDTTVTLVGEFTVTFVAAIPPKVTPVALVKSVPVMVTVVPPNLDPVFGDRPVMAGPYV